MTTPASLWDAYPIGSSWQVFDPDKETTIRTLTEITKDALVKYTSSAYPGVTFVSTLPQWVRWAETAHRLPG